MESKTVKTVVMDLLSADNQRKEGSYFMTKPEITNMLQRLSWVSVEATHHLYSP